MDNALPSSENIQYTAGHIWSKTGYFMARCPSMTCILHKIYGLILPDDQKAGDKMSWFCLNFQAKPGHRFHIG